MFSGKPLDYIVAIALFALTMSVLYVAWYVVHGRIKKAANKIKKNKDNNNTQGGEWGYEKDAYCYPKINDTMGFDFITVVRVNQEKQNIIEAPEKEKPNWNDSRGIGAIQTMSTADTREETVEDEPYPEQGQRPENNQSGNGTESNAEKEQQARTLIEKKINGNNLNNETAPDETRADEDNVSLEDIEALKDFPEWQNVWTNNIPSEEEIFQIVNSNSGLIEQPNQDDPENTSTASEFENMKKYIMQTERNNYDDEVDKLMGEDEIPGPEEQKIESSEEVDFIEEENHNDDED